MDLLKSLRKGADRRSKGWTMDMEETGCLKHWLLTSKFGAIQRIPLFILISLHKCLPWYSSPCRMSLQLYS
jgi:hypothetical protein